MVVEKKQRRYNLKCLSCSSFWVDKGQTELYFDKSTKQNEDALVSSILAVLGNREVKVELPVSVQVPHRRVAVQH